MKVSVVSLALGLAVSAPALVAAQAPAAQAPAGQAPAGQAPTGQPATQPPVVPPSAAQPPAPFPENVRVAVINIQRIASESTEGRASTAKVQSLNQQKIGELNDLNKKLQADQQKLQSQGSMLNEAARGELERSIDRQQKEMQRRQQDAQEEVQQLQQDLQNAFQAKLLPIIQQVVGERKITLLFSQADAGVVYWDPGLDLTADVIKRFNAAAPAATPAPASGAPSTTAPPTSTPPASTPPAPAPKPPAPAPKPQPKR
jgi:Skp family chaperone for outer membrane proteins